MALTNRLPSTWLKHECPSASAKTLSLRTRLACSLGICRKEADKPCSAGDDQVGKTGLWGDVRQGGGVLHPVSVPAGILQ